MNKKQMRALVAKFSGGGKSSPMMVSLFSGRYDDKHGDASSEEIYFVNSLEVGSCP
jgi:hypothetical protein